MEVAALFLKVIQERRQREKLEMEALHSCSPQECPTCKDKDCPNSYEDFLKEGELSL